MPSSEFTVVIPVLNEYESLKELLPRLLNSSSEVIICDNGSTDGTQRLVEDAVVNFSIRLSMGIGTVTDAILRGIREARYDKIVVMDGDLSHPPEVVHKLASALDEHDMVIGSRYCKGGGSGDTFRNRFISRGFNFLAFLLAPGIKDRASGFWGVRKELTSIQIRDTAKPMLEYLVRSSHNSVKEIPYVFVPRVNGKSKLGRSGLTILSEFYSLILLYLYRFQKPIKFCIVGGSGVGINLGILWVLTEVFYVWYFFSAIAGIFVVSIWNYVFHNFWTFKNKKLL